MEDWEKTRRVWDPGVVERWRCGSGREVRQREGRDGGVTTERSERYSQLGNCRQSCEITGGDNRELREAEVNVSTAACRESR